MNGAPDFHLEDFLRTLAPGTATQYASRIRAFLRAKSRRTPRTMVRADLVDYCAAIDSNAMRSKTVCALDAYFSYLEERDVLRHPASRLATRVAASRARSALVRELEAEGVSRRQLAALTWRDVAFDVVAGRSRLPTLRAATRARLIDDLLERLRTASSRDVASILDGPVLPP